MEEVCRHTTKNDAWTVVKDKVYDLSGFLNDHPGGYQQIARAVGRDGTIYFCKLKTLVWLIDVLEEGHAFANPE